MNHQHLLPIKTGHLELFLFNSGLPFIKWGLAEAFYSDKGSEFHKGMYEGYLKVWLQETSGTVCPVS